MRASRGFTLVEMCLVIVISGIVMVAIVEAIQVYNGGKSYERTVGNLNVVRDAIGQFQLNQSRYPCPAAPKLDDNNEVCTGLPAIGSCDSTTGICVAPGRAGEAVIIGALPIASLLSLSSSTGLSALQAVDGWNRKFVYAVTKKLTDSSTFDPASGAIDIVDENGVDLLDTDGTAHLAIFSLGDNGLGAYTRDGVLHAPCGSGLAESANCDFSSATFVAGLRSMGAGPSYFDDALIFTDWTSTNYWAYSSTTQGAIFNTNPGGVGVGTNTPTQSLDVTGNLTAAKIYAKKFCDPTGANCYEPQDIGGTGMGCSGMGEAVSAIGRNSASDPDPSVTCGRPFDAIASGNYVCDAGQYLHGFDAITGKICLPF